MDVVREVDVPRHIDSERWVGLHEVDFVRHRGLRRVDVMRDMGFHEVDVMIRLDVARSLCCD